jgi:hypothetical protein
MTSAKLNWPVSISLLLIQLSADADVPLYELSCGSFFCRFGFFSSTENTGFYVASTWYTADVIYLIQTTGSRKILSSSITK